MLPESAGDIIDREEVLLRFVVSDERALFPCPSALKLADNAVPRAAATQVVDRMLAGQGRFAAQEMRPVSGAAFISDDAATSASRVVASDDENPRASS